MPGIPLDVKLKKRVHKTIAYAQDLIVLQLYISFPLSVLHGGTAIWRCYAGNRFSEDIDVYMPLPSAERSKKFIEALQTKGLVNQKSKLTSNAMYLSFVYSGSIVSLKAIMKSVRDYVVRPYETVDGAFISVKTLSAETLLAEKVAAYLSRRKVRDLYDIYFLVNIVKDRKNVDQGLLKQMSQLVPSVDEVVLKTIVLTGAVPSAEDMLGAIRVWAKYST